MSAGGVADLVARAGEASRAGRFAAEGAGTLADLDEVERSFLKKGDLGAIREAIKGVAAEDRAVVGRALSEAQAFLREAIDTRRRSLAESERAAGLESERADLTVGGSGYRRGHLHLVTQIWRELEDVFAGLGYKVAEGPEVEDDWHNFEALNFPPGHPARAMQDTLYVRLGEPEQVLLRTHTSPVQIRVMEEHRPPIYFVAPGRVFRRDTLDARHSPVFHQIEGLVVDRGITMGDLMGTIETFVHALFGPSISARFLPSYFPFTEPSIEFSMTCIFCEGAGCGVCSKTGWIELGRRGHGRPERLPRRGDRSGALQRLRVRLRHRPPRADALRRRSRQDAVGRRRPLSRAVLR